MTIILFALRNESITLHLLMNLVVMRLTYNKYFVYVDNNSEFPKAFK